MTGEELKQSILQMAIQGKLVPQDPEHDEPAWKLLEHIKEEKDQLIKEKKIKKEKSLPPISEEEKPFEIPDNWEWVRLGEILKIKSGTSLKESYSGPLYIKVSDMNLLENKFEIVSSKQRCIPKGECLIYPKSIIFPKIGGAIATNKRRKVLRDPICIDPNTMALTVIEPNTFDYIFSWFANIDLAKLASGTALPSLNRNPIANLLIPLPPLEEQKRIVAKLEELQPLIDRYTQLEQKLSQLNKEFPQKLKESILQDAIQGKLTEQDYENDEPAWKLLERIKEEKEQLIKEKKIKKEKPLPPISEEEKSFEIPVNWEWVRLGEIGLIIGGGTPKTSDEKAWVPATIPWLTPADMRVYATKYVSRGERMISEYGLTHSSTQLLPSGSVIYSSRAPIGYVSIAKVPLATNQGFKSWVPIQEGMSEYIYYGLINRTPTILKKASGTTFKEISGQGMRNIPIPLPPLEEQKRIVEKLEEVQPLIDKLNQKVTRH